ncbi:Homeodomain-like superfamily protein [Thalictrum thalictroides]|uniref:Homeodomain-like superfamily protein n=1 Tax=Thalictrum thalictroides TaxID=46969 RepID=A0A7J6XAU8_THATH|nr:Homeodomain-like superfamily protein [Thalictrum thalictroides]
MAETKKTKKITISEEDIALLLQRYSATTIITLLQEVAQFSNSNVKIDWSEVVKKTSTGITNARECQMVWRHLAYRDALLETVDEVTEPLASLMANGYIRQLVDCFSFFWHYMEGHHLAYRDILLETVDEVIKPLDDDSDLESDLEVFPPVSAKAAVEAAAFSKVLLGSSLPSASGPLDLLEAPLTINIPTGQASTTALDNPWPACTQSNNITVPVLIQRKNTSSKKHIKGFPPLLLTTVPSTEELEAERGESAAGAQRRKEQQGSLPTVPPTKGLKRGGSTAVLPTQKKRLWKPDEDRELIAAVQRYGEGNWATILKGDFKADRTNSQLSQRWARLKKQQANLNLGGHCNPANSQLTAEQLATRQAVAHALDMPMMDKFLGATQTQSSVPLSSAAVPCGREDTSEGCQTQQTSMSTTTLKFNSLKGPAVPLKPLSDSDHMIEAAAVAAGARIATPSTAAPLLKCPTQTQSSIPLSSAAVPCGREDTSVGCRTQQTSLPTTTLKFNSVEGPAVPLKPLSGSDLMIEAAAVAAGARIATPSTAAPLLKCPTQAQPSFPLSSAAVPCGREDTSAGCQTQQVSKGMPTTALKFNSVEGPLKPLSGLDPMIQAAAIAAGARIATPSAAASLFKAAQSIVHISPGDPCPKVRYIKKGLPPLRPPPPPFSSSSPSIPHFGNSQLEHGKSTR